MVSRLLAVVGLSLASALKVPSNNVVAAPTFRGSSIMTTLAAFDSKGLSDKELDEMGSAIEKLAMKGDDASKVAVKSMSDFIVNIMIPNRIQSHKLDQTQLQTKLKALEHCHVDKRVQNDMNVAEKVNRAKDHKADYTHSLSVRGDCLQVLEGRQMVRDAYCSSVQDVKKLCENVVAASSNPKCCDAHAMTEEHELKCKAASDDMMYAKKQHGIIMDKVCDDYDTCYDTNLKAYTDIEKLVKTHEETRSWLLLRRIQCLVEDLKDRKVTEKTAKACKERNYKINRIEYPTVPAKAMCSSNVDAK